MGTLYVFLNPKQEDAGQIAEIAQKAGIKILKILTTAGFLDQRFYLPLNSEQYNLVASHETGILSRWATTENKYCIHNMLLDNEDGICIIPKQIYDQLKERCRTHKVVPVWIHKIGEERIGGIFLQHEEFVNEFLKITGKYKEPKPVVKKEVSKAEAKEKVTVTVKPAPASKDVVSKPGAIQPRPWKFTKNMEMTQSKPKTDLKKERTRKTDILEKTLQPGREYDILTVNQVACHMRYEGTEMIGKLKLYVFRDEVEVKKFSNQNLINGTISESDGLVVYSARS
ncbi:MAG: hypothetical protein IJO13_05100 [Lachnospiraceae bacterium]|nr:hypothetical protein [Lachnospiraceae bacterium]